MNPAVTQASDESAKGESEARDLYYEVAPVTPSVDAVSTSELRVMAASGALLPTTRVWRKGTTDWVALQDRPSLAGSLHALPSKPALESATNRECIHGSLSGVGKAEV